jgi:hydrogenase maturation factor HypF (carbamoyltransferase family)
MLVSSASYAGKTNKQFHAITKSAPSCIADVTLPAGAGEAQAQAIAATVQLAH